MPEQSPYPLGKPITEPRLLLSRRSEIETALDAVAAGTPSRGRHHALVLGEQRSGRTSVLLEVARRAEAERDALVVALRGWHEEDISWSRLVRHLLVSVVEGLVDKRDLVRSDWYAAWRDRVYLQDRRPSSESDVLTSALVFAARSRRVN
jgi:hypothetical protein